MPSSALAFCSNNGFVRRSKSGGIELSSSQIERIIKDKAKEEGDESDTEWATPSRIGRILRTLRLEYQRSNDKNRKRLWKTTTLDIIRTAQAYGVLPMAKTRDKDGKTITPIPKLSVRSGHSDLSVQDGEPTSEDTPEPVQAKAEIDDMREV